MACITTFGVPLASNAAEERSFSAGSRQNFSKLLGDAYRTALEIFLKLLRENVKDSLLHPINRKRLLRSESCF